MEQVNQSYNPNIPLEFMLDLETMGLSNNAAIIAIGCVAFQHNLETCESTLIDTFYKNVNLASAVKCGLVMEPDAVLWWLQQSEEARNEIVLRDLEALPITEALAQFTVWVNKTTKTHPTEQYKIWGNGADFDLVLLKEAYRLCLHMQAPWGFRSQRCYRTLLAEYKHLLTVPPPTNPNKHNALADAIYQADILWVLRNMINGKPGEK